MKDLVADAGGSLVPQIFFLLKRRTFGTRVVEKIEGFIEGELFSITHAKMKCLHCWLVVFSYPGSMIFQQKTAVLEVSFQVIYLCLVTNYLPDNKRRFSEYYIPTNYVSIFLFPTLTERNALHNLVVHAVVNGRELLITCILLLSSNTLWL